MLNLRKFLFEDEAVHDINSPSDYLYLKIIRVSLVSISTWPLKELGMYEPRALATFLKYCHLFLTVICATGGVLYIVLHSGSLNFLEIGHLYISTLLNFISVSRVITLTFSSDYRNVAKDFLTKTHLFFYKDNSEYAMKTHRKVHLVSHLFTLATTVQMIVGLSFFNLIPMYNNYSLGKYKKGGLYNTTFEHSIYLSYPFDVSTNMNGYIYSCIANWVISYLCATWVCMIDLFLCLMVFHLWSHFKLLIDKLNNFPTPSHKLNMIIDDGTTLSAEIYSKNELLHVSNQLKECIDYHREIKNFADRISDVFGPMLFVKYLYHQISGCLLLLECSQMTTAALVRYLPLTIICFQQLIQLSIIFELVGTASEKLKEAVYGLPWECMDTRNRKVVAFFLVNVQEPVHVKALGVADVGVTTMLTILKTSMSYFTFLRSI